MATHPMSAVDAAWYHMDGPANTAVVTVVVITRRPLDFERVRRDFKRRLLGSFDRFRQRVVERGLAFATPQWEDVATLDLDVHLRRTALPARGDESALRTLVEELASLPLDHSRPLWQAHVVDNVGAGGALIMRYHHCIGDGTAMMAVAARLFDIPRGALARKPGEPLREAPALDVVDTAVQVVGEAKAVLSDLFKSPDRGAGLKGEFGIRKRVAWSVPVPVEDVRAIGATSGAKVNDVLVAAVAGALRRYMRRRGSDVNHTVLRAMVPLDLRPPARFGLLGNEFGLGILDLPVSAPTPAARLAHAKAGMDALKHSAEAPAMRLLLDLFGHGPKVLEDLACEVFGSKASLVLTNVVGPGETIRLAGVPVDRLMFCVPHPGEQIGMGMSLLSYRGMVTLTVIADAGVVPNPAAITRAFDLELAAMTRRAVHRRVVAARPEAAPV